MTESIEQKQSKGRLTPNDKEIIRIIANYKVKISPGKIAELSHIHPSTVLRRVNFLWKNDIIDCTNKGTRLYCRMFPIDIFKKNVRKLL